MVERIKRASGKTGRLLVEILAAVLIGIGVPLFWLWLGSQIQGSRGVARVDATTAAIVVAGIVLSYLVIVLIAGGIQARAEGARRPPTRHPWMRSMRDEPYRPGADKLSPVETIFVGTAVVASIAMLVWFFVFAGSPLPT
jgi:hypothetical protein